MRQEIRTSICSMTLVPKPLKFLRPHYGTLKAYYETMKDSDLKRYLVDILSVLALTMSAEGERVLVVQEINCSLACVGLWKLPTGFIAESEEIFEGVVREVKEETGNVRFLANFITAVGIIIKRSSTCINAKAQRKVAREIKTAQAFGLIPFKTMGTKSFVFGKTMKNNGES